MYKFLPDITKEYVFSVIPQEAIFEKYLGVKVQTKKHFVNPLRKDTRVTCKFKYYGGDLIFTDFSGWFSGNCINFVKFLFNLSYNKALNKILEDFSNESFSFGYSIPSINKEVEKQNIKVIKRNFNKFDASYWKGFFISSTTLNYFNVAAVKNVVLNDKVIYNYNKSDPAYSYLFNEGYKIYFPFRREYRFISNTTEIQGWNQLPGHGNLLIITKSLKDVMCFYELGIPSISEQAETIIPKKEIIEELKFRFKNIYSFYDFDLTGIRTANKIKKLYNIQPILLTNGRFNTINYNAKDISDYIKLNGIIKAKELLTNFKLNG